ncbi:UNVERIFIED_CONTAM: protein N-terminal glutamine amidohydrolase [Sesamum latifolium]|uniref:Protein N-terminal glutamine amidohydrolase n=1 Tax=Sesamum latifolium TaxID=2727402 RepID=A0AAW2XH41_9LAMI
MATLNLDATSSSSPAAPPGVSRFHHTPCYCEENVYLLCKKLLEDGIAKSDGSDLYVVFISNEKKQANSIVASKGKPESRWGDSLGLSCYMCTSKKLILLLKNGTVWTTHVVGNGKDSTLPFPSPLATYVAETIRPSFQVFSEFQRFFRIVHAPIFLRSFASDRRHMKDSAGNWISPPPSYEVIVAEDGTAHNLNEYMEMSSADVVKSVGPDTIDAVLTEKLGVLLRVTALPRQGMQRLMLQHENTAKTAYTL